MLARRAGASRRLGELPWQVADAAKAGNLEEVKAWLAQPTADIDAEDARGWSLIHISCMGDTPTAGHVALAEYLLSRGADVNQVLRLADGTPLFPAVARHYRGQADMVGLLLRAGADVNARNKSDSSTPLAWAVSLGFGGFSATHTRALDCVVKLLRSGAALDAVGRFSRFSTPNADGELKSIEDYIARQLGWYPNLQLSEHFVACQAIIAGVRAAGSWRAFRDAPTNPWRAYERAPRKAVLRLRSLVARGRATTAEPPFKALFASPNEIVWHVLSFWDARIE